MRVLDVLLFILLSDIRFCVKNWKHLKVKLILAVESKASCGFSFWIEPFERCCNVFVFCWLYSISDCFIVLLAAGFGGVRSRWKQWLQSCAAQRATRTYIYTHRDFSGCYSRTAAHSHACSRPQGLPGLPGPPGPQVDALMEICTKINLAYMICQYCKNFVIASALWFYLSHPGFLYLGINI